MRYLWMVNRILIASSLVGGLVAAETDLSGQFYKAIRSDDHKAVAKLLANGASVNTRDSRGTTPLMYAAAVGSQEMVRKLLAAGADAKAKNSFDSTALTWCMSDLAKVRLLLDHGADVNARSKKGMSPLFIAAAHDGNVGVIRLLLERGADAKAPGPAGATAALIMAANANDTASARLLLKRGASAKAKGFAGFSALIGAAGNGNAELVKLLLANGADVNAQSNPVFETVRKGLSWGSEREINSRPCLGLPVRPSVRPALSDEVSVKISRMEATTERDATMSWLCAPATSALARCPRVCRQTCKGR